MKTIRLWATYRSLILLASFESFSDPLPLQVSEWYHPWSNLAPILTQYMDEEDEVLECGCGNSEMCLDMYDDGETYQQSCIYSIGIEVRDALTLACRPQVTSASSTHHCASSSAWAIGAMRRLASGTFRLWC